MVGADILLVKLPSKRTFAKSAKDERVSEDSLENFPAQARLHCMREQMRKSNTHGVDLLASRKKVEVNLKFAPPGLVLLFRSFFSLTRLKFLF